MFAVEGIYTGERTVQLESAVPVNEGYRVIVTFIDPLGETHGEKRSNADKKNIEWLKHPWKMDSFVPLTRDEIYDRT